MWYIRQFIYNINADFLPRQQRPRHRNQKCRLCRFAFTVQPSVIYAPHLAVPRASISLTCLSATLALQIHHCATFTQWQSVLLCVTRFNSLLTSSTLPTLLGVPSSYTQRLLSSSSKLLLLILDYHITRADLRVSSCNVNNKTSIQSKMLAIDSP